MPKEKFWDSSTAVEGDGSEPVLTVVWHHDCECGEVFMAINGVKFDRSAISRLIRVLRKARNQTDVSGVGRKSVIFVSKLNVDPSIPYDDALEPLGVIAPND